jgi:hypothetical protein
MGAGVPSCETCTLSNARRDDSPSDEDEDGGSDSASTSILRYRADEDFTAEGKIVSACWDDEPDVR